jgi:hypothetical protein
MPVRHGAGALAPEQSPLQEVLLAPPASRDGPRRAPGCALVGQEPLEDPDRGVEGGAHGAVLRLAVPPAVLQLFAEQPVDHAIDVEAEVGAQRDHHAVDAGLDLAAEEGLSGVLPAAVLADLRHGPAHPVVVGVGTQVLEEDQAVGGGGPGLALGLLFASGSRPPSGEEGAALPLAVVALE